MLVKYCGGISGLPANVLEQYRYWALFYFLFFKLAASPHAVKLILTKYRFEENQRGNILKEYILPFF